MSKLKVVLQFIILVAIFNCQYWVMSSSNNAEYYRKDGVKILHDPYCPEMTTKYGFYFNIFAKRLIKL
jgi:hypothetical protein